MTNLLQYPKTLKIDHTDTYFGTKVPDPYRWLEDDTSKATADWVSAQNKVTFGYLEQIPFRGALQQRLEKIFNYPKYSAPSRKGEYYFFFKNNGLQNQSVLYIQKGLDAEAEVFFDPNALSPDGTVKLGASAISNDVKYWAYGLSSGGSDWQEINVMNIQTRQKTSDRVRWVKVSGISWYKDGFFYSRYPTPPDTTKLLSAKNEFHQVFYHKLGTDQSTDELVYEDKQNPQRFHTVSVTDDERFLVLYISDRGKGKDGNAIYVRDLSKADKTLRPVITSFDDDFTVLDNVGDKLLVQTNYKAANQRVLQIDPANADEKNWKEIIPEKPEPLVGAGTAGGKLFAIYSKDVAHKAFVYALDGKVENEVKLPAIGTVSGFGGERDDKEVFFTFTSFTFPPTIYRYNIASKESRLFRKAEVSFNPDDYETKQVFFTSKDGTKVPMFIVHKKGITLDGQNPTLVYGYGGFNVPLFPAFSALRIGWLEQGGVYVQVNLRGGSEYGETWHEQGMKLKKQNVFDDFIGAAEWLIANKYTSSQKLAMQGGSNGGLLVGAVMCQRPELFKVALPAVGVMDMLRFHKFTIGWNWIADYGSAEASEAEFKYIYAYSPLHALKDGVQYPATLVTTADHDDRVVPAHSFKFAARLQEAHKGSNPVLIRIATKSGHGASNTKKSIEETADIYAFMMSILGMKPRF
jgi:prolyl oligopeptidase